MSENDMITDIDDDDDDDPGTFFADDPSGDSNSSRDRNDLDDFPYDVLTLDKVFDLMNNLIKQVRQVVQIPETTIRVLLNHFKWDDEKLIETYYESDPERIFTAAHIASPTSSKQLPCPSKKPSLHKKVLNEQGEFVCQICYCSVPEAFMSGLECGHQFCRDCWTHYLTTKIMDEGMGQTISCAAYDCSLLVDDKTVTHYVKNPKVKHKYQHLITNSFVECNRLLRWCPTPDCPHVIKAQSVYSKPVTCVCGRTFCFACSQNWHDPVKCHLLSRWIKKCDDDSETSNWIAANTKECPKCHSVIEKDGGCNHMVCKKCRFDFCWVCLGPWEPHGSSWYNCNKFDENDAKKARNAQEKSRAALQRYLFYCNRYMNHMRSLKLENKLYISIKEKMEEMQNHNMSWIEVQFLKKAVDILCSCRQTLMHTYVFAFYLKKNNQSLIFEDNQKDLEIATEKLSEYLERDITQEVLKDIKQRVQDKTRYCENRRACLTRHVHEGYENDFWEYLDCN